MKFNKTHIFILALLMLFVSCKDDEKNGEPSLSENKQALMELAEKTGNEMESLNNAVFVDALISFSHYIDTAEIFDKGEAFDYEEEMAIYRWDKENLEWNITDTNELTFFYPSVNIPDNDYLLSVSSYSDTAIHLEDTTLYYPQTIEAQIKLGKNTIFEISHYATYAICHSENPTVEPILIESLIITDDYNFTLDLTDRGLSYMINTELKRGSNIIAVIKGAEVFNKSIKEEVGLLDGIMRFGDIQMKGSINFAQMKESLRPDTMTFNEAADYHSNIVLYRYPSLYEIGVLRFDGKAIDDLKKISIISDTSMVGTAKAYYDPMIEAFDEHHDQLDILMDSFIGRKAIDILDIIWGGEKGEGFPM